MTTEETAELKALKEKVRILEDKEAIRDLKAQYARALDSYDVDAFMELFTDEAAWASKKGRFQGKELHRKNVEQSIAIMPFFLHMYVSPVIEILSETKARGTWYMFEPETLKVNGEDRAVWVCARYNEKYVKVNGKWKYEEVFVEILFQTSFDKGWVREKTIL